MMNVCVYVTDLGEAVLSDQFVAEAAAKWPGECEIPNYFSDCVSCGLMDCECDEYLPGTRTVPEWEVQIRPHMDKLTAEAQGVPRLSSLSELGIV